MSFSQEVYILKIFHPPIYMLVTRHAGSRLETVTIHSGRSQVQTQCIVVRVFGVKRIVAAAAVEHRTQPVSLALCLTLTAGLCPNELELIIRLLCFSHECAKWMRKLRCFAMLARS